MTANLLQHGMNASSTLNRLELECSNSLRLTPSSMRHFLKGLTIFVVIEGFVVVENVGNSIELEVVLALVTLMVKPFVDI